MTEVARGVGAPFEALSERYDAWYDAPAGRVILDLEAAALRPLLHETRGPRLEVGVGSGRFAAALDVEFGVDIAFSPLVYAARRGLRVVHGSGERLPFADHVFGAVVLVATLCFVDDPRVVLRETRRVLGPGGRLVVAIVPRDSTWGQRYQVMGRQGNPFYRHAHLYTIDELAGLLSDEGFTIVTGRSTLFQRACDEPCFEAVRDGALEDAGFVALAAMVTESPPIDGRRIPVEAEPRRRS